MVYSFLEFTLYGFCEATMFTIIKTTFNKSVKDAWLSTDERLFTLQLQNVSNLLDPYPLWENRFSGDSEITESVTGDKHRRLKNALENHRCTAVVRDERGWLADEKKVFCDVVVRIPSEIYQNDVCVGAKKLEIMADNLSRLHYQDFGDDLCCERMPSYVVIPDESLRNDEIIIQFGLSVFVPRPDDQVIGVLHLQVDGQNEWWPLKQWVFWENGRQVLRPAALYQEQQCLMIGASLQFAVVNSGEDEKGRKLWFGHNRGAITLHFDSETHHHAFGDQFISDPEIETHASDDETMVYRFKNLIRTQDNVDDTQEQLLLKVKTIPRISASMKTITDKTHVDIHTPSYTIAPGWGKKKPAAWQGNTFIIGVKQDQLMLEGLAMPRIDVPSAKIAGLESWRICFEASGNLMRHVATDVQKRGLSFEAVYNRNFLMLRKPDQKKFKAVKKLPFSLTDDKGHSIEIIASPLPDKYHAILQLPHPRFFMLDQTAMVIGRHDPNPQAEQPDIVLGLLTDPATLQWQKGREHPGAGLDAINLSRRHVKVKTKNGVLHVDLITGGAAAVFSLDQKGSLKDSLHPGDAKSIILTHGERLLVGCYLLRYEY